MQPIASTSSYTPPLLTTTGTSKYYSLHNDDAGGNNKIPDGEGYPYTVTRFTPDETGRVLMQSGVGRAHKLGSGHETKYYYGTPAQEELDGLFGTEVGNFTHYSKNMVKDANGQMSISYVDMHGRTIATALAGDSPSCLDTLDKNNPAHYPNQAGTNIIRNFLDNGSNVIKGNTIESINSVLVPVLTTYNFRYTLDPSILKVEACEGATPDSLCYDCLYDLEIAIVDESGELTQPVTLRKYTNVNLSSFADDDCSTSQYPISIVSGNDAISGDINGNEITFSKSLPTGSYSIRKTLSISESSFQHYKDLYISKALCKSEQEIIDSVYSVLITTSSCASPAATTCQGCIDSLGTFEDYRDEYLASLNIVLDSASALLLNEIHIAYANDSVNCRMICGGSGNISQSLPTIREMMLNDMMPYGGQYATEDTTGHAPGGVQTMYKKYNIFAVASPPVTHQPYYQYPVKNSAKDYYYDAFGHRDETIHPDTTAGHLYDSLNVTGKEGFTQLFKETWAASLLPFHPEYGRLLYAEANLGSSYNWISRFSQTSTWFDAQAKGYLDPTDIDSFFVTVPSYKDSVDAQIADYQNIGFGMWQLAYGDVKCKDLSTQPLRDACYSSGNTSNLPPPYAGFSAEENNQAWQVFRNLYMEARNRYVNLYIARHVPLPGTDEDDLVAQNYTLWFPRNYSQSASQYHWEWGGTNYPDTTHPPALPGGDTPYVSRCHNYINKWRQEMLQCDSLANHPDKDTILSEITARMEAVCIKGSNSANPYGSSTVAPEFAATAPDSSFEQIINDVFTAHGIISGGIYNKNYCNPYIIEWPKPYGKGPLMSYSYPVTGQIDSCNCEKYRVIKTQATIQGVNVTILDSLNRYLEAKYGDTLTSAMFEGLQHCGRPAECECKDLKKTVANFYINYPTGSMRICDTALVSNLEADSRTGNTPSTYVASYSITFLPGFNSGTDDEFVAYIDSTAICDTVGNCHDLFANYFNNRYHYNPPLSWNQIDSIYISNCGYSPAVCNTKDYSCAALRGVECLFKNQPTPEVCEYSFIYFFNEHYQNSPPLDHDQITALYASCDDSVWIHVCDTSTMWFCPLDSSNCVDSLPYILPTQQPLPYFLNCEAEMNQHCLSCADLSGLTSEFKTKFDTDINTAPLFSGSNLSAEEIEYNKTYARFINYRSGFQYGWLDYSEAAAHALPQCNLETPEANTNALQNVICGEAHPLNDTTGFSHTDSICHTVRIMAITLGQQLYQIRKEYLLKAFDSSYKAKCLSTSNAEAFEATYQASEYHYTLYYYDMSGNLVKTVPPKGVRPDFDSSYTNQVRRDRLSGTDNRRPHEYITQYRYNSLNQVIAQRTPDAGTSRFWYDRLGRLAVSQNSQQNADDNYSYTLFDKLGRIQEVGQKPQSANSMSQVVSQDTAALNAWINSGGGTKEQITRTTYDTAAENIYSIALTQQNLRNRVSYVQTFDTDPGGNPFDHASATYYTYDIHGNVDTLLQDYKGISTSIGDTSQRFKRIVYDYDLISGKVNQVNYQPGYSDAFYHKYDYDAENRITEAWTSRDKIYWERDAAYNYYKYGPLARSVIGQLSVQGLDYSYTLQGWLKGLNSTSLRVEDSMYMDGKSYSSVAKDVLGYALHYYDQQDADSGYIDYQPIHGGSSFARPGSGINFSAASLYNGNIAAMSVTNAGLFKLNSSTGDTLPLLYKYGYDQLNRIVSMQAYKGLTLNDNTWTPVAIDDYQEKVSYDPNGNIEKYHRNGAPATGAQTSMDKLGYIYYNNTNKLQHVTDSVNSSYYTEDIDDQSTTNNYTYDSIGNMVTDASEGISNISWTVYGKIKSITKTGDDIDYTYDAAGNRISKKAGDITTIYVRDASGNVMSVYENGAEFKQKELHLYGSSRLGMATELTVAPVTEIAMEPGFTSATFSTFTRGEKIFELGNHLGNVLATVSDKKLQVQVYRKMVCGFVPPCEPTGEDAEHISGKGDWGGPFVAYRADIVTATDYYPFGMQMPGRKYAAANAYRYGFNGKENDNDVKGEGNEQDYGMRIYDTRLGKFLSVDPLAPNYPYFTPYQFASNCPVSGIDLDGLEYYYAADGTYIGQNGKSTEIRIVDNEILNFIETTLGNLKDHRTIQQVFSDAASNKKGTGLIDIRVEDFAAGSVPAFKNTPENEDKVLSEWAGKNRTREREKTMSLFTMKVNNPNGKGQTEVFTEGSTGEGPKYTKGGASVDPNLSTSMFSNWKRSTTIHTHPYGGFRDFSNELVGAYSGGDLQWAVSNGVNLYLAPPSSNQIGIFNVDVYKRSVRFSLENQKDGEYFKKMSDAEMFKDGGVGDPYFNQDVVKFSIGYIE